MPWSSLFASLSLFSFLASSIFILLASRLQGDGGFNLGRSSEISRDELKFQKFILRLRTKFSELFYKVLEKQLVLTGVIADEEWEKIKNKIHFNFQQDNYFAELKNQEIIRERMNTVAMMDPYVGKYFSEEWVRKNILQLTDEDIEQMDKEMKEDQQKNFDQQIVQTQQAQMLAPPDQQGQPGQPQQPQQLVGTPPSGPQEPQLSK